jgi:hypothetical protein
LYAIRMCEAPIVSLPASFAGVGSVGCGGGAGAGVGVGAAAATSAACCSGGGPEPGSVRELHAARVKDRRPKQTESRADIRPIANCGPLADSRVTVA